MPVMFENSLVIARYFLRVLFESNFTYLGRCRKSFRKNPPEDRVTSGQNYLHHFADLCATALNIVSKEIISNNTKSRKQTVHMRTLKSTDDMTLKMKFYLCLYYQSEQFSRTPIGNFLVLFQVFIFVALPFRTCKKEYNILILVQEFCPLETEIARFPIGFPMGFHIY